MDIFRDSENVGKARLNVANEHREAALISRKRAKEITSQMPLDLLTYTCYFGRSPTYFPGVLFSQVQFSRFREKRENAFPNR